MIRIQTGKIRNTAAELRSQNSDISGMLEKVENLAVQVRKQSYSTETVHRLNSLKTQLGEINTAFTQLADALENICQTAETTEAKVVEIYESEHLTEKEFQVSTTSVKLNENLTSIAQITW